jgi:predicted DNA-binding protein
MPEQTIAIQLPQPLYQRLRRLAELTRRPLESLVLQALDANVPPLLDDMPEPIRTDLAALEELDDAALRQVAQGVWSPKQHARYTALVAKERTGMITPSEHAALEELYQQANRHMLRKAYANALLKWRGYQLPTLAELEAAQ